MNVEDLKSLFSSDDKWTESNRTDKSLVFIGTM